MPTRTIIHSTEFKNVSLGSRKNVIQPKVKDGKMLLERSNILHRDVYGEDKTDK